MVEFKEKTSSDEFKIVKAEVDGKKGRFVTDKRGVLYGEFPSKNIDEAEEFEEEIEEFRECFDEVIFVSRLNEETEYLYEIYINGVDQRFK